MQKIKLHLEVSPVIGYLHHAYPLSIARNHPSFQAWFNTQYIQLKYYPATKWLNFYRFEAGRYEFCSLLDYQIFSNYIMKVNNVDLINFIINALDDGCFVWIFIDEYHDPNRKSYHARHSYHENLLYGYDQAEKCFYSAGFDQKQNFSFSEIQFSDLVLAFNDVKDDLPVKLVKPNVKVNFDFDLTSVKDILKDYINSENTSLRYRMLVPPAKNCVYGAEIYGQLQLYLKNVLNDISPCDIRIIHIFWEHKKCMLSRIKYMQENNYFRDYDPVLDTYNEIERKVLTLRNQQFEYNLTGNADVIKQMIISLDELKANELMVLSKLLECLK